MKKIILLLLISFLVGIGVNNYFNQGNSSDYILNNDTTSDAQDNTVIDEDEFTQLEPIIDETEKDMESSILNEYKEKAADIQNSADEELNILVEEGMSEYSALSPEDRDSKKYTLAFKYMQKVAELEERYDKQFDLLVRNMKDELVENELNVELAGNIQRDYEKEKAIRMEELMSLMED